MEDKKYNINLAPTLAPTAKPAETQQSADPPVLQKPVTAEEESSEPAPAARPPAHRGGGRTHAVRPGPPRGATKISLWT